jgi:hypothetical protein
VKRACSSRKKLQILVRLTSKHASAPPNATNSSRKAVSPIGSHGSLDDLQRLQTGELAHCPLVFVQLWIAYLSQSCHPAKTVSVVSCALGLPTYSNMLSPAPTIHYISTATNSLCTQNSRSRLLNLTGFFSSGAGAPIFDVVELILWGFLVKDAGPDQGDRVLRRKWVCVEVSGKTGADVKRR